MSTLGCGASIKKMLEVSNDDIAVIEETLAERRRSGVPLAEAQKQAVAEAMAQLEVERKKIMDAINEQHPPEAVLTAPTRQDVVEQQKRVENAPALDEKAQIDREAEKQTLTQPTAPDQRSDTSGDMFALEKAHAEVEKKNEGKPNKDTATGDLLAEETGAEAAKPRSAQEIARAIAKQHPDEDVAAVRELARKAINDELGDKAAGELGDSGSMFRADDLTRAVHDGQYEAVREFAANMPVKVHETDIPREIAVRAYSGTSHVPEDRASSAQREYVRAMVDAWKRAVRAAGDDPAALERVTEQMQALRDGYRQRYLAALSSHANVASAMIVGPAKFPTERNRKRSDAADKKAQEASEFLKNGIARMLKAALAPVDNSPESELSRVKSNLEDREKLQAIMKATNAALRKGDDTALKALGLSDERIAELKKPDFAGRTGFPDYKLTNNNAEIRRLRERLASAEQRVEKAAEGPAERTYGGVRVEENAQDDRLRLYFDGKPAEEVRTDLKANGFRWSPSAGAWQRQLTDNARAAAESVLKKHFPPETPSLRQSDKDRAAASMKAQAIREAIAPAVDKLKIPFALHDTVADAIAKTGQDIPAGAKGMHWKGGIHLFGENLRSRLETEQTLWHEVQHAGLREAYGKTADGYEKALRGLSLQNGNIREAARAWREKYGEEDTQARIAGGMSPEDAAYRTKLQAIDEALAELAGNNAKINGLPLFIAKVQEFMRAIGLTHLADAIEKATNAQALAMITKSREAVMKAPEEQRQDNMAPAFSKEPRNSVDILADRDRLGKEVMQLQDAIGDATKDLNAAIFYGKRQKDKGMVASRIAEEEANIKALEKQLAKTRGALLAVEREEKSIKPLDDVRNQMPLFGSEPGSYSRAIDKASETLDRIKDSAAAKDVGTAWDGIQLATAPQYRSEAAREMARQLIAGMGEKEMRSIKFRTDLNRSIAQNEKATTLGAKARDLMEKGLTVQADKVFLRQSIEENRAFMQAMDTGDAAYFEKHADLKPMADVIAKMFAEKAQAIRELGTGALQNLRENYFPHLWNREPAGDAQREIFSTLAKRPLEGRKAFTKERIFDDVQAGLDAGFEPVSNNPLDLVALKMEEMDKYILAHKTLSAMEGSNGVHLIGAGEKTPKGFTDVNGRFGTIERNGEKLRYVAREDVAQVINNYLSPSLYHNKYVGKPFTAYMGAANMLNQFQLGVFSAFHAGFTSMEAVISHASIGVKALTAGDLKGAAKYLESAPAAWINNPKMGSKIIEHMLDSAAHPEMGPILEGLQMAGFKWQMDNRFRTDATKNMLQAWQEGKKFKAGVNSIPALAEQTARPILEWLVPRQKFGVFGEMYSKWMQDNPTATHEELRNSAQQIWNRVDSRLGQVVYDRLFVHNVAKNFAQMLIRAPGWTGGTILEVGGGIKDLAGYFKDIASGKKPDSISDRAAYTLSMLMVTATVNAAMTAMFTGAAPDDWRDLVAFRTGNLDEHGRPERFMLPTYMKDVYAYSKAPGTTLMNKAHPLLSLVGDIGKNRDFYGTEIRSEDDNLLTQLAQTAGFTAKAFVPFWVKGVQKEQQREGSALATAAPLFGVMPAPSDLNKTDAEKLITKYAADRLPQGSRTQEETEKADLRRQMYLALRKGEQDKAKEFFDQGRTAGLFGARDYLKVVRQARQDPLVSNFAHLTYDQAERVMRVANEDERQELAPAFMKKRVAWQRQHQGAGAE